MKVLSSLLGAVEEVCHTAFYLHKHEQCSLRHGASIRAASANSEATQGSLHADRDEESCRSLAPYLSTRALARWPPRFLRCRRIDLRRVSCSRTLLSEMAVEYVAEVETPRYHACGRCQCSLTRLLMPWMTLISCNDGRVELRLSVCGHFVYDLFLADGCCVAVRIEYSRFIVANVLALICASCVPTLFPICHLAFASALSSSVTVVGDRAVLSGIMQIVTSAVRALLM